MNELIVLLYWLSAPAIFAWAVTTINARPLVAQGLVKLFLGMLVVCLAIMELPSGALVVFAYQMIIAAHFSLAASSAALGVVEIVLAKLPRPQGVEPQ